MVLASGSATRIALLEAAGLDFDVEPARVDEEALRDALAAEGCAPRDMADRLAEAKAAKVAMKRPEALVLGFDQILELDGQALSKCDTPAEAREQLQHLRGKTHRLWSACVVYEEAAPVWRHIGRASLTMRAFSGAYLAEYLDRNWNEVREAVGCYHIEGEGVRLFARVEGDHFSIRGVPLIELLSWLSLRGTISG
jgi:septum formation protein